MSNILLFEPKSVKCLLFHKTCQEKFTKLSGKLAQSDEVLNAYLRIEHHLIYLITNRDDPDGMIIEDYQFALLSPAIERAAGDSLTDIQTDAKFNQKLYEFKQVYFRWYYSTAYKYKLPTLRIVPFLLRLL